MVESKLENGDVDIRFRCAPGIFAEPHLHRSRSAEPRKSFIAHVF